MRDPLLPPSRPPPAAPPSRTPAEESDNETPTLGSSAESDRSCGLFANHFSDATDCDRSLPRRFPRGDQVNGFRLTRLKMPPRIESSNSVGSKTPLLETAIHRDVGYGDYKPIPGRDHDTLENGDIFLSSARFYENQKLSKESKKKQNSLVTIFSVWNTIMGSSLLTMAWGLERAGLVPGILIMIFMGGLCLFTSYTLLQVCSHHGDNAQSEVADLCRLLLGRWAEVVAQVFSLVVMLGANIVYWVLMTNFLYYSVNYFRDIPLNVTQSSSDPYDGLLCPHMSPRVNLTLLEESPGQSAVSWGGKYWDLHSSVPLYVAIIIYPLLNFNSTTFFTKFNSLGTLAVLYLLLFVGVKGWGWGLHVESWLEELTLRTDASVLSGMLALSFFIHNIIITIMRNNRHQEKNGRDLSIAFVLVTLTYMLVGAVFYISFPLAKTCIEDNLLNNFAKNDIMTAVARVLLLFQVITVYPLIAYMLRVQLLGAPTCNDAPSRCQVLIFNGVIVTVCVLFACFVPRIGTIIRYTGAVSGLVHVFTLPSLLQMTSLHIRGKLTALKIIFYVAIFVIGACNLLAQFFVGD